MPPIGALLHTQPAEVFHAPFLSFFHAPCQAESVVLYPVLQSRLGQQGAQWAAPALAVSQCST